MARDCTQKSMSTSATFTLKKDTEAWALKINNPLMLAKISGHKDLKILLDTYYNPNGSDLVGLLD